MSTVAIISPGHMGSGLGWTLRQGGARVVSTVEGRSARTRRLAESAGLELLPTLADTVAAADIVLLVTPPSEAIAAAHSVRAAATHTPLIVDLNAVAPSTMEEVGRILDPLDLVDGTISGPPPNVTPGAFIYLAGPRAAEVAALPWGDLARPVIVGPTVGSASALKMCTASVYKGMHGLMLQAMRTAHHHGVLDRMLADLADAGIDYDPAEAGRAATKSGRFVGEMQQIAATQRDAGLTPALFEGFAAVYAEVSKTELGAGDPETFDARMTASEVVEALSPNRPTSA